MIVSFNWLRELLMPKPKDVQRVAQAFNNLGHELEHLTARGDDWAIDLTINPNRGDCLSQWGLARELAASWDLELVLPQITVNPPKTSDLPPAPVRIAAPQHCHRYIAWVGELPAALPASPQFMQDRLNTCGIRPINALVDIGNYVMLEMGQPLHIFDLAQVDRGIVVRLSRGNEKFLALDGKEYTLDEQTLLIADETKALAIAGVMGGEHSGVSDQTRQILLECAYFNPASIRRTSRTLGLSSESSFRFERDIDQTAMMSAALRTVQFLCEYAGFIPASQPTDVEVDGQAAIHLDFRLGYGERLLGIPLRMEQVEGIFTRLGMKVDATSERALQADIPTWRKDLQLEADLAEEIARMVGYDQIPTNAVECRIPTRENHPAWEKSHRIAEIMCGLGYNEACLPSITSASYLKKMYGDELPEWCSELAMLAQPLSGEMDTLTPSQLPTMLEALINNVKMGNPGAAFWSLGSVFSKRYRDYFQKPVLTLGIYGDPAPHNWAHSVSPADIFTLKGVLEALWEHLHLEGKFSLKPAKHPMLEPGHSAVIVWGDKTVGVLGELSNTLMKDYRFSATPVLMQLDLSAIYEAPDVLPQITVPSHFPAIHRDLSIVAPLELPIARALDLIRDLAGDLLESMELGDRYRGKNIPPDRISYLISLDFRRPDRTLSDEELSPLMEQIVRALNEKLGIVLRE
jgi:phenylalanyl-tRNA synthetase beta chain